VKSRAVQCSAVQCSAVQCSAVQCSAVQCRAVQCSVHSPEQCSAAKSRAVQGSAVQCSAHLIRKRCNQIPRLVGLHCRLYREDNPFWPKVHFFTLFSSSMNGFPKPPTSVQCSAVQCSAVQDPIYLRQDPIYKLFDIFYFMLQTSLTLPPGQ
jgi:hypothetical protein